MSFKQWLADRLGLFTSEQLSSYQTMMFQSGHTEGFNKAVEKLLFYPDAICLRIVNGRLSEMQDDMMPDWERHLSAGVMGMIATHSSGYIAKEHVADTPFRVVKAFREYLSGYSVNIRSLLEARFPVAKHGQMIHVKDVSFYSMCAHHLALISGTAHFAYIPKNNIVGISKIPRLIDAFGRRLQVQEDMTDQIVDAFMEHVQPHGCGLYITASHACMQCRGAKAQTAITDTTALRGSFLTNETTRYEFLNSLRRN